MAYDPSDPRAQLSATAAVAPSAAGAAGRGVNRAPEFFEFGRSEPDERTEGGSALWWVRSQSCIVNLVEAASGDRLDCVGQPDEYMILLPDAATDAVCEAGGERVEVRGASLVIVPPGDSALTVQGEVRAVRLFSSVHGALCRRCRNDGAYAVADPNVAPYQPWPDPPGGHRLRVYALDEVAPEAGRFGRIYRCSTLMVNYFYPDPGARDPAKLSPHHHDDFEQLSLQLAGDYVHHIRTPWSVDLADWRDDVHQRSAAPAVAVIPPPSIHTSQGVGDTVHHLVDIFCPPRLDFSARPGWVLNADDYPMPAG